jgi:hypothetical protein
MYLLVYEASDYDEYFTCEMPCPSSNDNYCALLWVGI